MDAPAAKTPLLSVRDLHVHFTQGGDTVRAVRGVAFDIAESRRSALRNAKTWT